MWVRTRQRVSFGFDWGLIWASGANVAGKQLAWEHLSWNRDVHGGSIAFEIIEKVHEFDRILVFTTETA